MNACCNLDDYKFGSFYPEIKLNYEIMQQWQHRNILTLPKCRNCEMALFCGGGCTRAALTYGKSINKGVSCPEAITTEEIQMVLNYYIPKLKERIENQIF